MATGRQIQGDRLGRELLTTLDGKQAVDAINNNFRTTVDQLKQIELRQRIDEAAVAVCRVDGGAAAGRTFIPTTLVQRTLLAGTAIVVFNTDTGTRDGGVVAEDAVAGSRGLKLESALAHDLNNEAPIYLADGDPLGLSARITSLESELTGLDATGRRLHSLYSNNASRLLSIKTAVEQLDSDMDGKLAELQTRIQQTADSITLQASKVVKDESGRITSAYQTLIAQTAEKIELTADRVTDLDGKIDRANTRITQTADSIQLFANQYNEEWFGDDSEFRKWQAGINISAELITTTVEDWRIWRGEVSLAQSEIAQTASGIYQRVTWEEFEELEGSQLFSAVHVETAGSHTTLTVTDVPTRLAPGDVLLVRDNDTDKDPWDRAWFEVTIGGSNEIPISSSPVALPLTAGLQASEVAIVGSPVYLRSSLFESIKTQTAFEISQAVLASQRASQVATVSGASLVGGSNHIRVPVPDGITEEFTAGQVLVIRDDDLNRSWVVTVGGADLTSDPWVPDAHEDTGTWYIPVVSFDPVENIPTGTPIWTSTAGLESLIQQFSDEIILQVTSSSPFNLGELTAAYDGVSPTESIAVTGLAQLVRAGDTIIHTRNSNGYKTNLVVTANAAQGATAISIESDDFVGEIGDQISLGQLSRLDIELGGISVDTEVFHSENWNGLMDVANFGHFEPVTPAADHGAGTVGWALTRNGDIALNNAWIRGNLQSTDWTGAFHATDGTITTSSAAGWALSKAGNIELNDAWIRGSLQSNSFDGHWNAARTELEIDTDLPPEDQEGSDVGTTGWALTQLGTAVFTDAKLRGDLDIVAGADIVRLNTDGLVVGGTVLGATEGLFLPMGVDNLYAGNALISWTNSPTTTATGVPRAHIGAHHVGNTITIGISATNAPNTKVYSAIDVEVANGKQFTTGNVNYPTTQATDAGYIPVTASATSLVWHDINIERVYDIGVWKQGNLLDNETFFVYNAPRNFVVQNITVDAGAWGSPSASISILGQTFTSSSISWTPGSPPTVSSISGTVSGAAGDLADVQVTVKAYWTGEGFDGPTLGAKDANGSVLAGLMSLSYTVTN